ncbi:transglycosylase-like protein [Candidatus Saccharibacteria bacterium RAAC3_TM7_1]|nr:transglycosylase-like protein [Candidatus Saccharibacteria bacterium RAAC3_TM7_1]HCZ28350.1 DUF348 domain-containing protein [Candidatus Saccharibacteria bacterium]
MRIRIQRFSPLLIFYACLVAGLGLFALLMIPHAQAAPASGERLITIHDRGREKGIITHANTLRAVFKEARVTLDKNDIVEPGLDETLVTNSYQVNIYRARPIVIVDGTARRLVMSAYQTPSQIAEHAGVILQDEDTATLQMASNLLRDGASEEMIIDRAVPVQLILYGKESTVYTQATTIEQFLKEKRITIGAKDTVSKAATAGITPNMKLEIWRNGKQTVTKEEAVAFETEEIQDANRKVGYRQVKAAGVKGKKMVTYEIVMKNGREVSKKTIQTVIIKQPSKQVEVVGAKFKYTGGPLSNIQITALGNCESGMTANRNSGNGFYGAFQFVPSTWRTVAPEPYNSRMPHQAPLEAQKQAVQNLLSRSSIYTQFPGCARKMQAQGIL